MKKFFLVLLCFLSAHFTHAQDNASKPKINWMTLEQAFQAIQKEPRKIVIDVYTGWCGWCKVMDQKTFTDPKVIEFINQKYYAVKLDAEQKEDITIGTQKFVWQNGYNQAGVQLLQGKMSFPTIVYLDEKFNMIQPVPGYQDALQFHQIITYFGDNHYKKGEWDKYQKDVYPKQYGSTK
ncbi:MAG: thioredoxin family protein [Flectobacillus sp.]|uniref:thioredoxin family protein n=1 Tax=Flectobacillus sp. TaxID=50419 RepID=UPI003B9B412D